MYVVRDVVRGKNLRQLLAGNTGTRPSPELIRRLILPVVDALEFAHAHGATHGGVSPENVIVADDGRVMVTDWATADPKAPHHYAAYGGVGSVGGDVKALGRVLAAYLPTTGAFGSPVVRGKIEGVIGRCDTLADLRETVKALEKLAAAPVGSPPAPPPAPAAPPPPPPQRVGPPPLSSLEQEAERKVAADGRPVLVTQVAEPRVVFVAQGGGGVATVVVRNDGPAPLIVRMIATQHAWLNVRPMDLPLVVAPNATERVEFYVSAARLSPGDYRSDVYLSANAGGGGAEDLQGGWFKHTTEIRLHVEAPLAGGGAGGGNPAPTGGAAAAGCGAVVALAFVVVPGLIWAAARHVPALLQVQ